MFQRLAQTIRRFMYGRYGSDQLNLTLLLSAVVLSLINSILSLILGSTAAYRTVLWPLFSLLIYGLVFLCIFRMLSHNIYKRQQENRRFRNLWTRLKDRQNRYFHCPACRQSVRVPKGKGKILIRCPKCGEKFTEKT